MPPCSSATSPNTAATTASSATSHTAADALPPLATISVAADAAACPSMSASTTWAPRAARAVPKALPKPRPPPVITATLPRWISSLTAPPLIQYHAAESVAVTTKTGHPERLVAPPLLGHRLALAEPGDLVSRVSQLGQDLVGVAAPA